MSNIIIREPKIEDKEVFLAAMQRSQSLHHPWVINKRKVIEEINSVLELGQDKTLIMCLFTSHTR